MRTAVLLLACLLPGCGLDPVQWTSIVGGVTVGTFAVIGRSPVDAVYSLATGKDCSAVRLEQGKTYCKPIEPQPVPPEFCTRSLGVVDCWQAPLPDTRQVASGSITLTPEQEANRTARWPHF